MLAAPDVLDVRLRFGRRPIRSSLARSAIWRIQSPFNARETWYVQTIPPVVHVWWWTRQANALEDLDAWRSAPGSRCVRSRLPEPVDQVAALGEGALDGGVAALGVAPGGVEHRVVREFLHRDAFACGGFPHLGAFGVAQSQRHSHEPDGIA